MEKDSFGLRDGLALLGADEPGCLRRTVLFFATRFDQGASRQLKTLMWSLGERLDRAIPLRRESLPTIRADSLERRDDKLATLGNLPTGSALTQHPSPKSLADARERPRHSESHLALASANSLDDEFIFPAVGGRGVGARMGSAGAASVDHATARGTPSHVRPSSRRPAAFLLIRAPEASWAPHCLKKNGTPAARHVVADGARPLGPHRAGAGAALASGTITQWMPSRSRQRAEQRLAGEEAHAGVDRAQLVDARRPALVLD